MARGSASRLGLLSPPRGRGPSPKLGGTHLRGSALSARQAYASTFDPSLPAAAHAAASNHDAAGSVAGWILGVSSTSRPCSSPSLPCSLCCCSCCRSRRQNLNAHESDSHRARMPVFPSERSASARKLEPRLSSLANYYAPAPSVIGRAIHDHRAIRTSRAHSRSGPISASCRSRHRALTARHEQHRAGSRATIAAARHGSVQRSPLRRDSRRALRASRCATNRQSSARGCRAPLGDWRSPARTFHSFQFRRRAPRRPAAEHEGLNIAELASSAVSG